MAEELKKNQNCKTSLTLSLQHYRVLHIFISAIRSHMFLITFRHTHDSINKADNVIHRITYTICSDEDGIVVIKPLAKNPLKFQREILAVINIII